MSPRNVAVTELTNPSSARLVALPAAVLTFKIEGFHLDEELGDLVSLWHGERWPALLLACGRSLRVLLAHALGSYPEHSETLDPPTSLLQLSQLGGVSAADLRLFRALSALESDAAQGRRRLYRSDGELALLITERLLEWYFARFPRGPQLDGLSTRACLAVAPDPDIVLCLEQLESPPPGSKVTREGIVRASRRTPAVAALHAGWLLTGNQTAAQMAVVHVQDALRAFPASRELTLLLARSLLILGEAEQSRAVLEQLNEQNPGDPDTLELLADHLKRGWEDPNRDFHLREQDLKRALELYQLAWTRTQETRASVGINAAVLGIIRGRVQRSEAIARAISGSYRHRWAALGEHFTFVDVQDRITLADASLILGDAEFARRRYTEAIELSKSPAATRQRLKLKLRYLLPAVGLPPYVNQYLDGKLTRRRNPGAQLELFTVRTAVV